MPIAVKGGKGERSNEEEKMKKSKVVDNRRFKIEDFEKNDFIPFLGGRPERMTVIQHDDIVNLSIILHTSRSLEEIMANL